MIKHTFNKLMRHFKDSVQQHSDWNSYDEFYNISDMEDVILRAIDKEIPKKGVVKSMGCYCERCDTKVGYNTDWTRAIIKYCSYCGHKIEWEEEKWYERISK